MKTFLKISMSVAMAVTATRASGQSLPTQTQNPDKNRIGVGSVVSLKDKTPLIFNNALIRAAASTESFVVLKLSEDGKDLFLSLLSSSGAEFAVTAPAGAAILLPQIGGQRETQIVTLATNGQFAAAIALAQNLNGKINGEELIAAVNQLKATRVSLTAATNAVNVAQAEKNDTQSYSAFRLGKAPAAEAKRKIDAQLRAAQSAHEKAVAQVAEAKDALILAIHGTKAKSVGVSSSDKEAYAAKTELDLDLPLGSGMLLPPGYSSDTDVKLQTAVAMKIGRAIGDEIFNNEAKIEKALYESRIDLLRSPAMQDVIAIGAVTANVTPEQMQEIKLKNGTSLAAAIHELNLSLYNGNSSRLCYIRDRIFQDVVDNSVLPNFRNSVITRSNDLSKEDMINAIAIIPFPLAGEVNGGRFREDLTQTLAKEKVISPDIKQAIGGEKGIASVLEQLSSGAQARNREALNSVISEKFPELPVETRERFTTQLATAIRDQFSAYQREQSPLLLELRFMMSSPEAKKLLTEKRREEIDRRTLRKPTPKSDAN